MKRKHSIIVAISSGLVLAIAIGSVPLRLSFGKDAGLRAARADFAELCRSFGKGKPSSMLADTRLRSLAGRQYRASRSLLLLAVTDREAGLLWSIPASSSYLAGGAHGPDGAVFLVPEGTAIHLEEGLGSPQGGGMSLHGVFVVTPQGEVFSVFRDAAILAAASMVLALVFALRFRRHGEDASWVASGPNPGISEETFASEFTVPDLWSPIRPESPPTGHLSEENADSRGSRFETGSPAEVPEARGRLAGNSSTPSLVTRDGAREESRFAKRLARDLLAANEATEDLTVIQIDAAGLSDDPVAIVACATEVERFFATPEGVFEPETGVWTVIRKQVGAEAALAQAEALRTRILDKLGRRGIDQTKAASILAIGLSSKSGRDIEASRLLSEARASVERAAREPGTRIVAFKADPEKFRAYMAAKAGRSNPG